MKKNAIVFKDVDAALRGAVVNKVDTNFNLPYIADVVSRLNLSKKTSVFAYFIAPFPHVYVKDEVHAGSIILSADGVTYKGTNFYSARELYLVMSAKEQLIVRNCVFSLEQLSIDLVDKMKQHTGGQSLLAAMVSSVPEQKYGGSLRYGMECAEVVMYNDKAKQKSGGNPV